MVTVRRQGRRGRGLRGLGERGGRRRWRGRMRARQLSNNSKTTEFTEVVAQITIAPPPPLPSLR